MNQTWSARRRRPTGRGGRGRSRRATSPPARPEPRRVRIRCRDVVRAGSWACRLRLATSLLALHTVILKACPDPAVFSFHVLIRPDGAEVVATRTQRHHGSPPGLAATRRLGTQVAQPVRAGRAVRAITECSSCSFLPSFRCRSRRLPLAIPFKHQIDDSSGCPVGRPVVTPAKMGRRSTRRR